jgi:hypothetical protein
MMIVTADTERLAPLVTEAYVMFQQQHGEGATKLEFCKLFATKEQLDVWPETDRKAKEAGSPIKALFNGIDYLIRRAKQLETIHARQEEAHKLMREAEDKVRLQLNGQTLTDEELDAKIKEAQAEAVKGLKQSARTSIDDVIETVFRGWQMDLDTFDTFAEYTKELLGLKYSEAAVTRIIDDVRDMALEAEKQGAARPDAETTVVAQPQIIPADVIPAVTDAAVDAVKHALDAVLLKQIPSPRPAAFRQKSAAA